MRGRRKAIARAWMPRVLLGLGLGETRLELIETRVSRDTRSDLGVFAPREARTVGPLHRECLPGRGSRSALAPRRSSQTQYVRGRSAERGRPCAPCVYYLNDINTVLVGTTRSHRHTGHVTAEPHRVAPASK